MDTAEHSGEEARVEAILEAWFLHEERGEKASLEDLCRDVPHLVPRVREMLRHHESAEQIFSSLGAIEPIDDPTQRQLGDFEILQPIGEGGMAKVFLARQTSLDREVALKILRTSSKKDPQRLLRFRREAEITAALDHPNIVPIYAVGEEEGVAFLAMKRLGGRSLDALLPFSPHAAARVAAPIARALHAAHRMSVIHRDVKPSNVIVDDETPYLLDFGLARMPQDFTMTREGSVAGTLPYMSPEQLRGDRSVLDARTDVYSLGATLYEMIAGRPPFLDDRPESLIRRVLFEAPPPLQLTGRHRDLATLVMRSLEKEPERRFPTAEALADELERYLDGRPIETRRIGPLTRTWRLAQRHRRVTVPVSVLLLTVIALLLVNLNQRMDRNRIRERTLDRAQLALDQGRYVHCQDLLDDPSLDPADGAVSSLRRRLAGLEAQERLLDALQGNLWPTRRLLRTRLAALDATGGRALRRPLPDLALVVTHIVAGEQDRAREALTLLRRDFGNRIGTVVLEALIKEEDPWAVFQATPKPAPPLAGTNSEEADQLLFASFALRLHGTPAENRREVLLRALDHDPGHYRARCALARLEDTCGNFERARAIWQGLVAPGNHRSHVLRGLARQEMVLGELDRAERSLAASIAATPPHEVATPRERARVARMRIELAWRRGQSNKAFQLLDEARRLYPRDAELYLLSGAIEATRAASTADEDARMDRIGLAFEHFAKVRELSTNDALVDPARISSLDLRYRELPGATSLDPLSPLDRDEAPTYRELRKEALELAKRTRIPAVRSDALLLACRASWVLDERNAAWNHLHAALEADPANCPAQLRYALQVFHRLQVVEARAEDPWDESVRKLRRRIPRSLHLIDLMMASRKSGRRPPTLQELLTACEAGALLAHSEGEPERSTRYLDQAEEFLRGRGPELDGYRKRFETLRQFLER